MLHCSCVGFLNKKAMLLFYFIDFLNLFQTKTPCELKKRKVFILKGVCRNTKNTYVNKRCIDMYGYFTIPDYPASDLLTAISVGVASGLTSTGVDQLVKRTAEKG